MTLEKFLAIVAHELAGKSRLSATFKQEGHTLLHLDSKGVWKLMGITPHLIEAYTMYEEDIGRALSDLQGQDGFGNMTAVAYLKGVEDAQHN